jgi:hypothetical protein
VVEQTPASLFLRVLRAASIVCAAIVALIMAIELWKRWLGGMGQPPAAADYLFFAVLIGLFLGLVLLCRAISRELHRSHGS